MFGKNDCWEIAVKQCSEVALLCVFACSKKNLVHLFLCITVVLCTKQTHKNLIIVVQKSRPLMENNQSLWGTKKIFHCEKEY